MELVEAILVLALCAAPLLFTLFVQVAITASGLAGGTTVTLAGARFASLDAFVDAFGEALGLAGVAQGSEPRPESARFAGVLTSGRSASVEFASAAWRAPLVGRAGVELDPGEVARLRRLLGRGDAVAALGVAGVQRLELRPRTGTRNAALGRPVVELSALVPDERGEMLVVEHGIGGRGGSPAGACALVRSISGRRAMLEKKPLSVSIFAFASGSLLASAVACAPGNVSPTPAIGRDFISTAVNGPGSAGVCCGDADAATGRLGAVAAAGAAF